MIYQATPHFAVGYDNALVANGALLADAIVARCEQDLASLSGLFSGLAPLPPPALYAIYLDPPSAGAMGGGWNNGFQEIHCVVTASTDAAGPPGLVAAELAEIFMNVQQHGWVFNGSNGESLSRVLASVLYPDRAAYFAVGNRWLNSSAPVRPDRLSQVYPTDQDMVANGCGTLFLNYLAYQLNVSWPAIIAACAPGTNALGAIANTLGFASAVADFLALMNSYFPANQTWNLPTDNPFPLLANPQLPSLYLRHNLADNGASHTGPLSNSPDIIVRNNVVPSPMPQGIFGGLVSIASETESDPYVLGGQDNYVYLRVWNRGAAAANVSATVYWSEVSTLVTPNLWHLIGSAQFANVPAGLIVKVSDPGVTWSSVPAPGHYCFVATVGNAQDPAPAPGAFASFDDFVNYIYTHNDITWRNFNVAPQTHRRLPHWLRNQELIALPFRITGAWDKTRPFDLEVVSDLPHKSQLAVQVPQWLAREFAPNGKPTDTSNEVAWSDKAHAPYAVVALRASGRSLLGQVNLPAKGFAPAHLLVYIPPEQRRRPYELVIRQMFEKREVGRVTWRLVPTGKRKKE